MNAPVPNLRVLANAGSGKTFLLTSRYLQLLAAGVAPDRIIALTFTRKAAGEFLDKILQRLMRALQSGEELTALRRDLGAPKLQRADCLRMLRLMLDGMPKLALGTMDSFFGKIVRNFPLECGLGGGISLLEGQAQTEAERRALLAAATELGASARSLQEFVEIVRRASRDNARARLTGVLADVLDQFHDAYLQTPENVRWGELEILRPFYRKAGNRSVREIVGDLSDDALEGRPDLSDKNLARWWADVLKMAWWTPASPAPKAYSRLVDAVAPCLEGGQAGIGFLYRKKFYEFEGRAGELVLELTLAMAAAVIRNLADASAASFEFLAKYDAVYRRQVTQSGMLTFLEITGLLASAAGADWRGGNARGIDRQAIDYRLDSRFDHWMLDEFQDTSRLQWHALSNLVDEAVQDAEGRKSFFFVGDVKQAIYGFRGGDSRLFDEIFQHYHRFGPDRLADGPPLTESYRCRPAIIEFVNGVFGGVATAAPSLELPEDTVTRWEAAWRSHEAACKDTPGHVRWQQLPGLDDEEFPYLVDLLREIEPDKRGLSCAVLVRTNDKIPEIANALRVAGMPASAESRTQPCCDNPLGVGIIALLQILAHPGDTQARELIRMTPLEELLGGDESRFRLEALRKIEHEGFAALIKSWIDPVHATLNEFSRQRARIILAGAGEFERQGRQGIDQIIRTLRNHEHREPENSTAIRVMTIHAAKGLTFDMVVLPYLEGTTLTTVKNQRELHTGTDERNRITWATVLPSAEICRLDPVLKKAREQKTADIALENLCNFYVATTRPKYGLYLFTKTKGEKSTARDFPALLLQTLRPGGETWERGRADWFAKFSKAEDPASPVPARVVHRPKPAVATPQAPSHSAHQISTPAADIGLAVHELLQTIGWLGDEQPPALEHPNKEAVALVRGFLRSEPARRLFTRPTSPCLLWRERRFDVIADGQWLSGVFDRVVVITDAAGQPQSATIYDFKTDETKPELLVEHYGSQMRAYLKSLGLLTSLPSDKLGANLVSIRHGVMVSGNCSGLLT
jgi:ATP-dependent exoDNAse (exonuclease V) beta subunit